MTRLTMRKYRKSAYLLALTLLLGIIQACGGGGGDSPSTTAGTTNTTTTVFHLKGNTQVYTTEKPVAIAQLQLGLSWGNPLPVFVDGRNAGVRSWTMAGLAANSSAFNLVSVDSNGVSQQAIESPYLNRVAYTVRPSNLNSINGTNLNDRNLYIAFTADPYPGDDEDFSEFITRNDPAKPCALYHVNTETDAAGCVLPNVEPVAYFDENRSWGLFDGGNRKPIQFDAAGNIYVAGYPFSVNSSGKVVKDKNARLYKISTDFATATPLTQNNESVTFFALFPSGEPVVALKKGADLASMELALYRNGTQRISLATSIVDPFVNTDSYRTLLYGSAQGTKGINLVRTNPLGVDSANFDYNSGKGSNYNRQVEGKTYTDLVPRRIILSEEGNFYSVYSATEQGGNNVLLVYQTLPFDRNAKAVIPVGGVASWWAEMKNRPIQIRNGILYYAKSEVRPNIGNVDVIQVVRLSDGVKQKLFGDKSYRIDSWQAVGDKLFFSGIDNATNKLVQGSVSSTQFAASGADWSDEAWSADVKVTPTASAKEASIQIQDMENLTPVQPLVDPGNPAAILKFESTEKSALFSFNKYMKTDTVETVLSLRPQKAGVNAPTFFPVWGYQKLHLVYDSSDGGLSLPDTEGLRSTDGRFDFVASNNLPDAYNNQSIPSQDITGNSLYTVAAIAIDTQPLSQTVTYGDAVTFSVVANGNGTLTYQWIKNGWLTIPGATSSTYTILSTNNANNGERYSVEVSNDVGKVASSDATLMVTRYSLVAKASGGFYDKTECVKDLSTGLIWEGKNPIGSSSRPADGTYTNYDSSHTGGTNINDSANSIGYVNSVNALSLCGFTDWRLPTDGEQSNIMITGWGTPEPKIDTTWFPNAQGTQYWTSTRIYGNDWLLWINDFKNHQITSDLREPYKKLALRLVHAPSPSQ